MLERLVAQRSLIGWLALVGLLGGVGLCLWQANLQDGTGGSLLRVGLVLGALWQALPERCVPGAKLFSFWQILVMFLVMMAVVRRPWIVLPVLLILGVIGLFARPRV